MPSNDSVIANLISEMRFDRLRSDIQDYINIYKSEDAKKTRLYEVESQLKNALKYSSENETLAEALPKENITTYNATTLNHAVSSALQSTKTQDDSSFPTYALMIMVGAGIAALLIAMLWKYNNDHSQQSYGNHSRLFKQKEKNIEAPVGNDAVYNETTVPLYRNE